MYNLYGSIFTSIGEVFGDIKTKFIVYTILGIIVIVIISLLLDGVRKYIRGLDTAALGALLLFVGYKTYSIPLISTVAKLLLVGGTLFVVGILVFVIFRLIKRKHNERVRNKIQQEQFEKNQAQAQEQQKKTE